MSGAPLPASEEPPDEQPPAPPRRSRDILLNMLASYGRLLVDMVTLLVLTPFLVHALGDADFGLWSLVWAFVGLFELMDLGLAAAVVKYVAEAQGRGDEQRLRQVTATLFWIYSALACLLMLLVCGSALFLERLFDLPPERVEVARVVLIVLGARLASCLPLGMFRGVLAGHRKQRVADGYKALASLGYFVAVLLLLSRWPDLRTLALLNLIAGVLPMLAMAIHAQLSLPGVSIDPRAASRGVATQLASFSIFIVLIQVSRQIYTRVDALIIGSALALDSVALYAIAMQVSSRAQQICFQPIRALGPIFAELHGSRDWSNIRATWLRGSKLAMAIATPLLVGLAVLSEPLIVAWIGPGYAPAAPALALLAIAGLVAVMHGNTVSLLSMAGEERYLAMAMIGGQLLNIALSLLLIGSYGITGVAAATLLSALPLQCLVLHPRASRLAEVGLLRFYRGAVLPCLLPTLAVVAGLLFWSQQRPRMSLLEVGLAEGAAVVLFGALFWRLGLDAKERAYYRDRVWRRLARAR